MSIRIEHVEGTIVEPQTNSRPAEARSNSGPERPPAEQLKHQMRLNAIRQARLKAD